MSHQHTENSEPYRLDPSRRALVINNETGIFVRGLDGETWTSLDIVTLDRASLLAWLRSRGGKNEWAENVVGLLLGHVNLTGGALRDE